MQSDFYLGLTGLAGAGKDTAADLLENIAKSNDLYVLRFKLSDEIRDELRKLDEIDGNISRASLINRGNEIRASEGDGALASRTLKKYSESTSEGTCSMVIFSGIRTLGEATVFRNQCGKRFVLLSVLASPQVRKSRMASREQYQEDANHSAQVDQADQDIGILACIQAADYKVSNDGSLEQLEILINAFFEQVVQPILSQDTTVDET